MSKPLRTVLVSQEGDSRWLWEVWVDGRVIATGCRAYATEEEARLGGWGFLAMVDASPKAPVVMRRPMNPPRSWHCWAFVHWALHRPLYALPRPWRPQWLLRVDEWVVRRCFEVAR